MFRSNDGGIVGANDPETFIATAIIGAGIAGMAQPGKALDC